MDSNTIKISYMDLSIKINELKKMRTSWDAYTTKVKPELSGGGMTVSMCDQIADAYKELYKEVCLLLDNSISFLENVHLSIGKVDNNVADALK